MINVMYNEILPETGDIKRRTAEGKPTIKMSCFRTQHVVCHTVDSRDLGSDNDSRKHGTATDSGSARQTGDKTKLRNICPPH
jgi:hypothetical protein